MPIQLTSEEQRRANEVLRAVVEALGYKVVEEREDYYGTDVNGFGIRARLTSWPAKLEFVAIYPGKVIYNVRGERTEAGFTATRTDVKKLAADVKRRVLVPAAEHVPAVLERRAAEQRRAARRAELWAELKAVGFVEGPAYRSGLGEPLDVAGLSSIRSMSGAIKFGSYRREYAVELHLDGLTVTEAAAILSLRRSFGEGPPPP